MPLSRLVVCLLLNTTLTQDHRVRIYVYLQLFHYLSCFALHEIAGHVLDGLHQSIVKTEKNYLCTAVTHGEVKARVALARSV
jgi:hypothetical protein